MQDFVFITGNQHKLEYLEKWLGHPVEHQKIDLEEIQSLDAATVLADKARRAYDIVGRPVLVEDVSLVFMALGRLPGTYIKSFLEELGTEGLCRIISSFEDKRAVASITYGLFDGEHLYTFAHSVEGTVPSEPRAIEELEWKSSLSWNSIFIPDGSEKTYAQMDDGELKEFSHRAPAVAKLKEYISTRPAT